MTLAAHAIVVDRPVDEVYDAWSDRPALSVDFDPRNPLGYLADTVGVPDRAVERVLQQFQASMSSVTTSSDASDNETLGASPHARGHAR
jgi:hypothetical protein